MGRREPEVSRVFIQDHTALIKTSRKRFFKATCKNFVAVPVDFLKLKLPSRKNDRLNFAYMNNS